MCARAFSILFELRACVFWNLKTTIQINENLTSKGSWILSVAEMKKGRSHSGGQLEETMGK